MKKIRNLYACAGVATLLTTLTFAFIDLFKYFLTNMDNFGTIMPIAIFIVATALIAASNWTFAFFLKLFDAITGEIKKSLKNKSKKK